jgi:hypothetical protein
MRVLVEVGFPLADLSRTYTQKQISVVIDANTIRTFDSETNATGIGAGRNQEVVFELLAIAVISKVNP